MRGDHLLRLDSREPHHGAPFLGLLVFAALAIASLVIAINLIADSIEAVLIR